MKRGIRDEYEIVHELDRLGFAVLRSPSSGSGTKLDRPDIIAGRKDLHLAIEVKSTHKDVVYIDRESVKQLTRFSERFGATPLVAVKFTGKGWFLFEPQNLTQTGKAFKVSLKDATKKGKTLDSIVTKQLINFLT